MTAVLDAPTAGPSPSPPAAGRTSPAPPVAGQTAAPPAHGRRRPRRLALAAVVLLAASIPVIAGYARDAARDDEPTPVGPGLVTIELSTRYSTFSAPELAVYEGTLVQFVVRNDDPIHHELIVGPRSVHEAHEKGSDVLHPPVPGEVQVGPGETRSTIYRFEAPGTVELACHLPGHLAYGMRGTIQVLPLPATTT